MVEVAVDGILNANNEGEHGEDDLVDEDVKVEDKEVGKVEDNHITDEDEGDILVVDFDDLDNIDVDVNVQVVVDVDVDDDDGVSVMVVVYGHADANLWDDDERGVDDVAEVLLKVADGGKEGGNNAKNDDADDVIEDADCVGIGLDVVGPDDMDDFSDEVVAADVYGVDVADNFDVEVVDVDVAGFFMMLL